VFFIALPIMLEREVNFYLSFTISIALTLIAYLAFYKIRGEM
jgi:hypothetical protein